MKLNIGCGLNILDGYVNVDKIKTTPDTVVKDILNLDYPDDSAEEIYVRHVIEHFFEADIKTLLKSCHRMLQPGGKLVIETPDFERIVEAWTKGILSKELLNKVLFGFAASANTRERELHMMHKFVFDEALLASFLVEQGFTVESVEKGVRPSDYDPKYGTYVTAMRVVAVK
jgi:predicted SAM-dependent methyltransferase